MVNNVYFLLQLKSREIPHLWIPVTAVHVQDEAAGDAVSIDITQQLAARRRR